MSPQPSHIWWLTSPTPTEENAHKSKMVTLSTWNCCRLQCRQSFIQYFPLTTTQHIWVLGVVSECCPRNMSDALTTVMHHVSYAAITIWAAMKTPFAWDVWEITRKTKYTHAYNNRQTLWHQDAKCCTITQFKLCENTSSTPDSVYINCTYTVYWYGTLARKTRSSIVTASTFHWPFLLLF